MHQLTITDIRCWLEAIEFEYGPDVPLYVISARGALNPPCRTDMAPCVDMRLETGASTPAVFLVGAGVELEEPKKRSRPQIVQQEDAAQDARRRYRRAITYWYGLAPVNAAWMIQADEERHAAQDTGARAGQAVEIEGGDAQTTRAGPLQCSICGCTKDRGYRAAHDCWWVAFYPPVCSRCG